MGQKIGTVMIPRRDFGGLEVGLPVGAEILCVRASSNGVVLSYRYDRDCEARLRKHFFTVESDGAGYYREFPGGGRHIGSAEDIGISPTRVCHVFQYGGNNVHRLRDEKHGQSD